MADTDTFLVVNREYTLFISPEEIEFFEEDGIDITDDKAVYEYFKNTVGLDGEDYTETYWLHTQKKK
jgi:hypothetical protein